MENTTISKRSLETLTREVLSFWECDYVDMGNEHARYIAIALDEAIALLGLQPELDHKAQLERERAAAEWQARLDAKNSKAD